MSIQYFQRWYCHRKKHKNIPNSLLTIISQSFNFIRIELLVVRDFRILLGLLFYISMLNLNNSQFCSNLRSVHSMSCPKCWCRETSNKPTWNKCIISGNKRKAGDQNIPNDRKTNCLFQTNRLDQNGWQEKWSKQKSGINCGQTEPRPLAQLIELLNIYKALSFHGANVHRLDQRKWIVLFRV